MSEISGSFPAPFEESSGKSAKFEIRPVDSGFMSSSDFSESFTSENSACDVAKCAPVKSEFSGYFSSENAGLEEEEMKVDNRVYSLSHSLSKIKIESSCTNNLGCDVPPKDVDCPWQDNSRFLVQDEHGNTHLHLAIYFCYTDLTLKLIKSATTAEYLDLLDQDGQSPLHLAVATNQPRIVRCLIVAGAHAGTRNAKGESPLHIAARLGYYDCCRAILEPVQSDEFHSLSLSYNALTNYKMVDLEQWNYEGQTCAHVAALHCNIGILRLLIQHGADINAREGRGGFTILHFAIQNKMEKLAYFLLSECTSLEANATTYAGKSVLQLGLPINRGLSRTLLLRGAASPYTSEDEDMEECEDEILPQNRVFLHNNLVNGCA